MKEKSKNKPGSRFLTFLLALAILPAMQAFPAWAGEATSNPSVDLKESEETIYAAREGQPANPVHHCTKGNDGTDYTDWSYIYFGSYPQTEVTGGDLTSAITGASYDTNGDAWVEGMKYRRISKEDTNYSKYFGENMYRYFKWERIKWKVLQNDGSTLFVLADRGLGNQCYYEPGKAITWEGCTLRQWLNDKFCNTAFSSAEQEAIVGQALTNEDTDKVYVLSIEEVTNSFYGFCGDSDTYSVSRRVQISDYSHIMGTWTSPDADYYGNGWWWLRSSGDWPNDAARVSLNGGVDKYGIRVDSDEEAVVPVLHINLSSGLWYATDDGTSGEGGGLDGQEQGGDSQPPTDASQEPGGDSQPPTDISQKPGGDDNQGQQEIKVKKISISGISKKIAAGKKISLKADVLPKNAANPKIKWQTNNKRYATVNSRGVVTTKKAGKGKTVTIKAMATDGSKVKASYKIKLMKHAVTKVKIKNVPKNLKAGKSILLKTTVRTNGKNANKALKWSTSNKKYASVDSKGKVKIKKAGKGKTVTITATATDGSNKKASVRLKIK